jgi:hypothetical protein
MALIIIEYWDYPGIGNPIVNQSIFVEIPILG